ELHVELKPGLRFHSGAPFEARDVVATLQALGDPKVASREARIVETIAEVRAEGANDVVIVLKHPHATLLTDLEMPILRADQAFSAPAQKGELDGLGPYKVKHLERGAIDLVPADSIFTPKHAVVVRTVHDENARALRLLAGSSDVDLNVISPTLLPSFEGQHGLSIVSVPSANLTYAILRGDRGPFADVEARKAFSATIDREAITQTLLAGRAKPAATLLPPTLWAHTDLPPLEHRPTPPPFAGPITLLTSTDRLRVTIARFVAQEANDAGWNVEVVPLELGALIARLNAGDFDAAFLQIPELAEPNALRVFMASDSIPPAGANRARIRDQEIDALLHLGDLVTDLPERKAAYAALEKTNRDHMYLVPLWHEDQVAVRGARASEFVPSAEGRWLSLVTLR
ncbi:MAG TPA: ABC transporter substrate-binding protein, partial [Polyangiaceae bacterium]